MTGWPPRLCTVCQEQRSAPECWHRQPPQGARGGQACTGPSPSRRRDVPCARCRGLGPGRDKRASTEATPRLPWKARPDHRRLACGRGPIPAPPPMPRQRMPVGSAHASRQPPPASAQQGRRSGPRRSASVASSIFELRTSRRPDSEWCPSPAFRTRGPRSSPGLASTPPPGNRRTPLLTKPGARALAAGRAQEGR
jgi:hypothetical protein